MSKPTCTLATVNGVRLAVYEGREPTPRERKAHELRGELVAGPDWLDAMHSIRKVFPELMTGDVIIRENS